MKKLATLTICIAIVFIAHSQNIAGPLPADKNLPGNSYFFDFSGNADQLATGILNTIGLKANFRIRAANVENVQAVIRRGHRYIKYNPSFINGINKKAKDQWASIFILAHEIGHHLDGHTALKKKHRSPVIELEADEFAGFVMRKLGATLEQAIISVMYVASPVASDTHPGTAERVEAVKKGWLKGI
jgi:hypothetical protein